MIGVYDVPLVAIQRSIGVLSPDIKKEFSSFEDMMKHVLIVNRTGPERGGKGGQALSLTLMARKTARFHLRHWEML